MRILFLVSLLLVSSVSLAGENIRLLAPAASSNVSVAELGEIERLPTERHREGGNAGMKAIADRFGEYSYAYTGGRYRDEEIKFRLRIPDRIKPGKKYPLIVWFHGNGEGGEDNMKQLAHMQYAIRSLAGPESGDFYLLATQTPGDNMAWRTSVSKEDGKGDAGLTVAREIMETLVDEFPIDTNRIGVFGLSSGGEAAWAFVLQSPERFSGLVCCSAVPPEGSILTGMNVWAFACTGDTSVPVDDVRDAIREINKEGGSALLTEIESTDHDSWSTALREKNVLLWLAAQRRDGALNPPPGFDMKYRTIWNAALLFGLPALCLIVLMILPKRRRNEKAVC